MFSKYDNYFNLISMQGIANSKQGETQCNSQQIANKTKRFAGAKLFYSFRLSQTLLTKILDEY